MLLVDDHQTDVRQRREHRGAWPNRDPRLARRETQPLVVALALAHTRVHHRDDVAEPRLKAVERLRGQRDLRDQHDRAPPRRERRCNGLQVDLRLARPGDTVKQQASGAGIRAVRAEPAQRLEDRRQRPLLVCGQLRRRRTGRSDGVPSRPAGDLALLDPDQATRLQSPQPIGADLGGDCRAPATELFEQLQLAGAQCPAARRRRQLALECQPSRLGQLGDERQLAPLARRRAGCQHEPQCARGRRAVFIRHPLGERDQVWRDARGQDRLGLCEPVVIEFGRARQRDHHPERRTTAERHPQQRANPDLGLIGTQAVVEWTADRSRAGQRLHPRDHGRRQTGRRGPDRVRSRGREIDRIIRPGQSRVRPGWSGTARKVRRTRSTRTRSSPSATARSASRAAAATCSAGCVRRVQTPASGLRLTRITRAIASWSCAASIRWSTTSCARNWCRRTGWRCCISMLPSSGATLRPPRSPSGA